MRRARLMHIFLFAVIAGFFIAGYTKPLPVSGVAKAASDNQPIDSAMVVLFEGSLTITGSPDHYDTVFTKNGGKIEKVIAISDTAKGLVYVVYKTGYLVKTGIYPFILGIPNTVDLGTLLLKTSADAKDTLTVKGVVVDSSTRLPLANATVVVTSGLIGDLTVDSIPTDADGNFQKKIPYIKNSPLFNEMLYFVSKKEYAPKSGRKAIPQNEIVDLDTIALFKTIIQIKNPFIKLIQSKPTHIAVYALNGKMIYKGPIAHYPKVINKLSSSQQLIIRYYSNGKLLGELKEVSIE